MSILNGLYWGYLDRWGSRLISIIVFVILARYLTPQEFGLVAFAKIFIDYLDVLSAQGLGLALIQRKNVSNDEINSSFWMIVFTGLILCIFIYLLSDLIETIRPDYHGLAEVLRLLSLSIVINSLSRVQVALLTKKERFKELSIRGIFSTIVGALVGILAVLNNCGVWSIVYQTLASSFASVIVLWKLAEWFPNFSFSFDAIKPLYKFSFRVMLDQQVIFFSKRIDEAVIGLVLGANILGYYSIAKRIYLTFEDMLYSVLAKVTLASMSNPVNHQENKEKVISNLILKMGLATFPLFILCATLSSLVIEVVFGSKWLMVTDTLSILMLSGTLLLIPNILHPYFYSLGNANLPLKLNSIRAFVSLLAFLYLSQYGMIGIAFGYFIRNFIGAVLDVVNLSKYVAAKIWHNFLKALIYSVSIVMSCIFFKFFFSDLLSSRSLLFLSATSSSLIYLIMLMTLNETIKDHVRKIYLEFKNKDIV